MSILAAVLCVLGLVAIRMLTRRPRHDRPCPEVDGGRHEFLHCTDEHGWYLTCLNCGCRTEGWKVPREKT